jgi:hypothetical protein
MWIRSTSKDLGVVWYASHLTITNQMYEIQSNNSTKKGSTPAALSNAIYHPLMRKITHHALYEFVAQYTLVKREAQEKELGKHILDCTGNYYRSIGVPCWHMIKERLRTNAPFQPNDFHPH